MSDIAKRVILSVILCVGLALSVFADSPIQSCKTLKYGNVCVSVYGEVELIAESSSAEKEKFEFSLKLGEGYVLRGIEIFNSAKEPIDFDITDKYEYSFVLPKDGAHILLYSEDHKLATRAECVEAIWNFAKSPCVDFIMSYKDIPENADYIEAVRFAEYSGIISSGDKFRPNDPVTREELAVMVYRYAQNVGLEDEDGICVLPESVDRDSVSEWALEAVCWNIQNGVLNEFSGAVGYFSPQEQLTVSDISDALSVLEKLIDANNAEDVSNENSKEIEKSENIEPVKEMPKRAMCFFSTVGIG